MHNEMYTALSVVVKALRNLAQELESVLEAREQVPTAPEQKALTEVDVREVASAKANHSRENADAVRELVKKYGAGSLSQIDPAHFPALMEDLKALGGGGKNG